MVDELVGRPGTVVGGARRARPCRFRIQLRVEANLGRCWARASNPPCGTLCRRWVRLPLASANW